MPLLPIEFQFSPGVSDIDQGLIKAAVFNHYILLMHRRQILTMMTETQEENERARGVPVPSPRLKDMRARLEANCSQGAVCPQLVTFVAETFRGAVRVEVIEDPRANFSPEPWDDLPTP